MIRYYGIAQGKVQGVGFRFFCQINANILKLTGWVRNMDNGMVEFQIQGSEEKLQQFLSTIRKGNRFVKVEDISLNKLDIVIDEKSFKIV